MYHPGLSAAAKAFACAPLAFSRFYWFASLRVNLFLEFANKCKKSCKLSDFWTKLENSCNSDDDKHHISLSNVVSLFA